MGASKVILVNKSAGEKKYGKTAWRKIKQAINKLIVADKRKDFVSQVYEIDSKTQMKSVGGKPVTKASSASQVKRAIDAIFESVRPHYLMILGGPDLIPHVQLRNPIGVDEKEDDFVPSDLPYACDAGYGLSVEKFIGPTRVIGRLPDVTGKSDPDYLIKLLDVAAMWESRSKKSYSNYFGISANVWKGSTRKNVSKLFGTTKKLQIVPPKGLPWSKAKLKPRVHFINCHGVEVDSLFYGENDESEAEREYPEAHSSVELVGCITPGTVVAAECCFGAQLYAPIPQEPEIGIANRYLYESAYGFLGSTNVAWGLADGIALADLICQLFVANIQDGASLGRALLEARQQFVKTEAPIGPHSLKTLAQFTLLGDPSVHPVKSTKSGEKSTITRSTSVSDEVMAHTKPGSDPLSLFKQTGPTVELVEQRSHRRLSLFQHGLALAKKIAAVRSEPEKSVSKSLQQQFKTLARETSHDAVTEMTSYVVDEAVDVVEAKTASEKKRATGGTRFMIAFVDDPVDDAKKTARKALSKKRGTKKTDSQIVQRRMLVASEKDGKIESYVEYYSR